MRLLATIILLSSSAAWAKSPATLEDLQALSQQKAYAELLERAEDIAPAARTDAWQGLVASAAVGVVTTTPLAKDPFGEVGKADALLARFAFLDKRAAFSAARDEAVLKGLKRCVDANNEACIEHFVPYEPSLGATASLKAGKMLRHYGAVPYRSMLLFAKAAAGKDGGACKDPDVSDAVIAALDLPPDHRSAKAAQQVAFESCWPALQAKLKSTMVSASASRLQNSCVGMRAKKALTPLQEDLCKDEEQNNR